MIGYGRSRRHCARHDHRQTARDRPRDSRGRRDAAGRVRLADARLDSDLDILLEHAPRSSEGPFFDLFKIMHLIEDTVGVTAHISTPDQLTPRIRERMADDLVEVF